MSVTKEDVRALMRQHKTWSSNDIAEKLNCLPEYVRSTCNRNGWILPKQERIPHIKIPIMWIEKAKIGNETTRETLDRVFRVE